ncbi:MAG: MBL fold metallo-hydrolase [Bacteroidaceae bacterium]|nr:MBL fold metallo-hydrolase [Bacteroidaceae bacterium]
MKKYIMSALLLCGMAQLANAQGYYIYKNGVKQTVMATEMDSLVFFREAEKVPDPDPVDPDKPLAAKDATERTADLNKEWYERLDFTDNSELENAKRGLIEATPDLLITNERGEVWNMAAYKFLLAEGEAPSTVNPSLWRNAMCNVQTGLFKVCEGIYQVRGYDMANMTFIKTKNGWMIFDVLMGKEVAQAAIDLFKRNIDTNPRIVAVLISHSHADHYGGVGAIVNASNIADANLPLAEQIKSGKIAVITPAGFMKHVIAENAYCNAAMSRRASYQYGANLPKGVTGRMAMGIGMGESTNSPLTLMPPTYEVTEDETVTIDGITVTFQLTPGTEAPAEMNAYFPDYRALWMAENCTGTLHNLYTLRGAAVRDAEGWCNYILEAETKFADKTDVVFQSHNWPHWGTEVIKEYLENTAAIYKFIHDQTLHYINLGYTSTEIANTLRLPEKLDKVWYTRQYYGTLSHDIKAVYQRYMGWYDANPVNLNLLSPDETAKKLVEYMGGDFKRILEMARADYAKGDYQWVAQVTKELVYADPSNMEARRLCADALEQLGYQCESGTWRNAYLTGAMELRAGTPTEKQYGTGEGIANMLGAGSIDMIFEYAAIATDSHSVENNDVTVNFIIGDEKCCVVRRNGVVLTYKNETFPKADATAKGTKAALVNYLNGNFTGLTITGNEDAVNTLFSGVNKPVINFNIIEP